MRRQQQQRQQQQQAAQTAAAAAAAKEAVAVKSRRREWSGQLGWMDCRLQHEVRSGRAAADSAADYVMWQQGIVRLLGVHRRSTAVWLSEKQRHA
jgi:nucleotide-binding universal stress UspA family protein